MAQMQKHLRNTFLAGIFAFLPLAITAFIIYWVEAKTRPLSRTLLRVDIPFIGVLLVLAAVYACGLVATSLLGKFILRGIDRVLSHLPVLRSFYAGWKHVALTPGGTEGIFSRVTLIPDETGHMLLLGFTSARPIDGNADTICVFVPASPNPVNGRLYFVRRARCQMVDLTTEEAFKIILSTGNYVPTPVGAAAVALMDRLQTQALPQG